MEDLKKTLVDLERAQAKAFNKGDVKGILGYFDKDLVGFSSTRHARLKGLRALRQTIEYYLTQADKVDFKILQPQVQAFGDVAVVSFYWTVTLEKKGKSRVIEGRGTHVYAKRDGAWKVVHEHFSRAHHAYEKK
ncbi:MAG: nuclear transport factor 2 family protein [candidate division KSB1 bacterium]|nr:nuclear transport factor 2 family protein [candidate division KSB1 bacterium]